jgi:hypothetical protein
MKSFIVLSAAALVLASCAPATTPAPAKPQGLCTNMNCKIGGAPSLDYYQQFMVGVDGSCAKPNEMSFTSAIAQLVMPKENTGFAQIHLYLKGDGTYTGAYAEPVGAFGTFNPETQGHIKATKVSGTWYLENDKMVVQGLGIGRKNTADEMLLQPISSSKLSLSSLSMISFSQMKAPLNEQGQTVAEYCAAQPPVSAAAPVTAPAPVTPAH